MSQRQNAENGNPGLGIHRNFASQLLKILFGFAVFYFVVELVSVIRLQAGNEFTTIASWNPVDAIARPFLVLVGVTCLVVDRPWSLVLAVLIGVGIIYPNVYLGLKGIASAHGVGPFSFGALSIWLETTGARQIINTAVSLIIVSYSGAKLIARNRQRFPKRRTTLPFLIFRSLFKT